MSSDNYYATYSRRARKGEANPNGYDYTPELTKKYLEDNEIKVCKCEESEFGYTVWKRSTRDRLYHKKPIFIKEEKHKYGKTKIYACVALYDARTKKPKIVPLHRLVYLQFKGNIPKGMVVDHIDNDPLNNSVNNLQLLTRAENIKKDGNNGHNQYTCIKKEKIS